MDLVPLDAHHFNPYKWARANPLHAHQERKSQLLELVRPAHHITPSFAQKVLAIEEDANNQHVVTERSFQLKESAKNAQFIKFEVKLELLA